MTHDEKLEFIALMERIKPFLTDDQEIVVVDDFSSLAMVEIIRSHHVKLFQRSLKKDFSAQRNFTQSKCSGQFIFMIDPDELPSSSLLMALSAILDQMERERLDGCIISRFNKLIDLDKTLDLRTIDTSNIDLSSTPAEDHVRIYRNSPDLTWVKPLHEKLIGLRQVLRLPSTPSYAILHVKTKERAASQVAFYNSIGSTLGNIRIDIKFRIIRALRRTGFLSLLKGYARQRLIEVKFHE
jgi:glycosyltransferase involved in cell wall biosynthesis